MFSFAGNMKFSVSESGQNAGKDREEGGIWEVENGNFVKQILLAGFLEDSNKQRFVLSPWVDLSIAMPLGFFSLHSLPGSREGLRSGSG